MKVVCQRQHRLIVKLDLKEAKMKYVIAGLLTFLMMRSAVVCAELYIVTAAEIDRQIQQRFPIIRQYDEVEATFYNPKVVLKYLDNEIQIKLQVKVNYRGQFLVADGLIKGTTSFQQVTNTLRFERPILDEFFVTQDKMSDSSEAIKVVKQSISHSMPPIVLLNFENFEVNSFSDEPRSVTLTPQGLELRY